MRRALAVTAAVAALGALLLSGCRNADTKAGGAERSGAVTTSNGADPAGGGAPGDAPGVADPAAPAAGQPGGDAAAGVDAELDAVDGLLGEFDDQTDKANQTPPDAD